MTKPLPKWLMERYSLLWKKFKEKEFDHNEAASVLNEKKERLVSVVLSDLKRHGWLTISLHPEDSRKRIYKLKNPESAIEEIDMKDK